MRFQSSYGIDPSSSLYALPTPMKDRAAALRAFSLTPTLPRKPSDPAVSTLPGPRGTQTDGVVVYTAGYAPDETNTYSMQVIKVGDQRVVYEGEPEYNKLWWSGDGKGLMGKWKSPAMSPQSTEQGMWAPRDLAPFISYASKPYVAAPERPSDSSPKTVSTDKVEQQAPASPWYMHPTVLVGGTLAAVGLYLHLTKGNK